MAILVSFSSKSLNFCEFLKELDGFLGSSNLDNFLSPWKHFINFCTKRCKRSENRKKIFNHRNDTVDLEEMLSLGSEYLLSKQKSILEMRPKKGSKSAEVDAWGTGTATLHFRNEDLAFHFQRAFEHASLLVGVRALFRILAISCKIHIAPRSNYSISGQVEIYFGILGSTLARLASSSSLSRKCII